MIESLLILSPRGDAILHRNFRRSRVVGRHIGEIFLKRLRELKDEGGPVVCGPDCRFVYVKRNGLFFVQVLCGELEMPVCVCVDLLNLLTKLVKDMCGVLCEDNIRRNFLLLNEIVDELYDFGFPIAHRTHDLSPLLSNAPSSPSTVTTLPAAFKSTARTIPSHASQQPIPSHPRSEIFIDIVDRINAETNALDGSIIRSSLDGMINIKCYFKNYPKLNLAFNEDLQIDNPFIGHATSNPNSSVVLESYSFDQCVDATSLLPHRFITFSPPQGEFTLMRYRSQKLVLPFVLCASCNITDKRQIEITAVLKTESYREVSGGVSVAMETPIWVSAARIQSASDAAARKGTQSATWSDRKLTWVNKALEISCNGPLVGFTSKLDIDETKAPAPLSEAIDRNDTQLLAKYLPPFVLEFELPMYSSSRLQIRYLRSGVDAPPPQRWVRYVTHSGSVIACF